MKPPSTSYGLRLGLHSRDKTNDRLKLYADLAQMCPGLLVAKGVGESIQRKSPIDHGLQAGRFDGADHLLLLTSMSDDDPLQADLLDHHHRGGNDAGEPR